MMTRASVSEILKAKVTEYEKRRSLVERVINSDHLCRIFFLILDGTNYTEKIAEACGTTPKSMTINIRKLREAKIIKRKEREGVIQRYEPDWAGIWEILKYHYTTKKHTEIYGHTFKGPIKSYHSRFSRVESYTATFKKEDLVADTFDKVMIENFLKPYFEKRVIWEKEVEREPIFETKGDKKVYTGQKKYSPNFVKMNERLKIILDEFERGIFFTLPKFCEKKIQKLLKNRRREIAKGNFEVLIYEFLQFLEKIDEEASYGDPEYLILDIFDENSKRRASHPPEKKSGEK